MHQVTKRWFTLSLVSKDPLLGFKPTESNCAFNFSVKPQIPIPPSAPTSFRATLNRLQERKKPNIKLNASKLPAKLVKNTIFSLKCIYKRQKKS